MSSYYREHVSFPNVAAGPYPPHLIASLERDTADNNNATPSTSRADDMSDPRLCSVKGCSSSLPADYPHKMCEECRGRHRVYAMTKRAKRKMEKALLNGSSPQNGQNVVWMPQDDGSKLEQEQEQEPARPPEPVAGPSRQYESQPQVPPTEEEANIQQFDFPQGWDSAAIDPRLFSQASELAGALILPPASHQGHHSPESLYDSRNDHEPHLPPRQQRSPTHEPPPGPPPAPPTPEIHPVLAEVLKAVPNFSLSSRVTSGPTVSTPASAVDGPLPPRFCSIKGCKTLIAGNSFFKMCEPCRDRYRNYGTTKRAKWRREKEVVVAELHKLRAEEDARRAAQGLPPLPPEEDNWHEYSPPHAEENTPPVGSSSSTSVAPTENGEPAPLPPRMCTVSHCREILPGDYQFLRCERHRIQNRHHSKLKRVRDKEVKAQVHDGWAAAVGAATAATNLAVMEETDEDATVPDVSSLSANEVARMFGEIEKELRDAHFDEDFTGAMAETSSLANSPPLEDTPLGEPSSGLPPAARGTRRTNHVCSIKTCSNLLSPSNPWKMCDLCRSRDRAGRRLKALRDSGLIPPELAAGKIVEVKMEVEGREREKAEKGKGKKKGKETETTGNASDTSHLPPHMIVPSGSSSCLGAQAAQQNEVAENTVAETGATATGIAPSAYHTSHEMESGAHASAFSSMSLSSHANLVFMEPMLGELASTLEHHLSQVHDHGIDTDRPDEAQSSESHQDPIAQPAVPNQESPAAVVSTVRAAPKKVSKGKGRAKARSQPDSTVEPTQQRTEPVAAHRPLDVDLSHGGDPEAAPQPSPAAEGLTHPPPPYAPPHGQPPYSYYMPPPYMPPYGPPINYHYGYPPYGSYPYPYPYPGQPFPYPGHPYPPPPSPSQSYATPSQPYSPTAADHPQPPVGQVYSPQMQPYPYALQYPPSSPSSSSAHASTPSAPPTGSAMSSANSTAYEMPPDPTVSPAVVKRKRGDSFAMTQTKRAGLEAAGHFSTWRISLGTTPHSEVVTHVEEFPSPEGFQQTATGVVPENTAEQQKPQCSNKNCKRVLNAGTSGTLCDRCRDKLKKKQALAKHRFKLEPKSLLGRSNTSGSGAHTSIAGTSGGA